MSSAVLYLAIVAVWAVVLVPMWLRRDTEATGISRLLHKRQDEEPAPLEEDATADDDTAIAEEVPAPTPRRRTTRAAVIARRRRRTSGLTLLLLASVGVTASGLAPWWAAAPAVTLLAGHLALLRVAVGMDAARHQAAAEERAARAKARREARQAAAEDTAEVIELVARPEEEVFDQYADDRRVVGG